MVMKSIKLEKSNLQEKKIEYLLAELNYTLDLYSEKSTESEVVITES